MDYPYGEEVSKEENPDISHTFFATGSANYLNLNGSTLLHTGRRDWLIGIERMGSSAAAIQLFFF